MATPPNSSSVIGISVSSAELRAVTLDSNDTLTPGFTVNRESGRSIGEQTKDICAKASGTFAAAGLAIPGLIAIESARIVDSRIHDLIDLNLREEFGGLCGGNVVFENDVNAAAFAELKLGAGRGRRNIFCAFLGEGVGSGLILNSQIWHGSHGFAGEFGLIVVDDEGTRLEDIASAPNIIRRTINRLHQDSTSVLSRLGEDGVDLDAILAAANEGDDLARLMLERTGFYVGSAIGTVMNLLDVGLIVLGGELTKVGDVLLDAVVQRAKECALTLSFTATNIVVSELADDASAIGAALLARGSS